MSEAGLHSGWLLLVVAVCVGLLGTTGNLKGASDLVGWTMKSDTVTVEGQITVVGSEPFTRMRLVEKGGGGYILAFDDENDIDLRRQGPTKVRVVGVPYRDVWQGQETRHLRVVRWEYRGASDSAEQ